MLGGAAVAAGPLAVLAGLPRGKWELKELGATSGRTVCAPVPMRLIQLNHPADACAHFTIADAADRVTIQYNCGPHGYGRTTLTVTQPGQIRLETQGISLDGRPFDMRYEGQFVGPCAPSPPR